MNLSVAFQFCSIVISVTSISLKTTMSVAQVSGDQTFREGENTVVIPVGNVYTITGGASRGNNLFHSFEQFSLSQGEQAFFDHDSNIDTILSRVTGSSVSNIDGIISVDTATSTADIFFINPQGIVFGPNAALDIGGSFIASTAEEVIFTDGSQFTAVSSQPVSLTVSQPAGLVLGDSSGSIVYGSVSGDPELESLGRLGVISGETIGLIGNGIELSAGKIISPSSRVELASLAPGNSAFLSALAGTVGLSWTLDYQNEEEIDFQDIVMSSGALISVTNDLSRGPSGDIQIRGRRILIDDSKVRSNNYSTLPGGTITVIASEQLSLSNQSQISVSVFGDGDGGDLIINAPEGTVELENSSLRAQSVANAVGAAGTLTLSAESLSLRENSFMATSTFGRGRGGSLVIEVSGAAELRGNSRLRAQSFRNAMGGAAGTLTLSAESLSIREDSFVTTTTLGEGRGGDLSVYVSGMTELLGNSRLLAQSDINATGAAGTLTLSAESLSIQEDSFVATSTFGQGRGGNLTINVSGKVELIDRSRLVSQSEMNATGSAGTLTLNATDLSIQGGSLISVTALGNGLGGKLLINAPDGLVEIIGISPDDNRGSLLTSTTQGTQNAGEIEINTRDLRVQNGGVIQSGTSGSGNGGETRINATNSVVVASEPGTLPSQITSSTSNSGDAGFVIISTSRLVVDNATISTSTNSSGQGGELTVNADEVILSSGSEPEPRGLLARTSGSGDSGRLTLATDTLSIRDGARLTVSTDGDATSDNLGTVRDAKITARTIAINNGQITAESLSGNGGNLNLNVQDAILLRNNSLISATAGSEKLGGNGGNVNIDMPNGFLIAVLDENNDIIANAFSGKGGNIDITTQGVIGLTARPSVPRNTTNDIDASSQFGASGTITINNLGLDPTQGLIELPIEPTEPNQVSQRCAVDSGQQSTFVNTRQGGVPLAPRGVVRNETTTLIDLSSSINNHDVVSSSISGQNNAAATNDPTEQLPVEAQGWHRNQAGTIILVAPAPMAASMASNTHQPPCARSEQGIP